MIELPVMDRNNETVTLGKNDPDKVNHGDFNQIWPGKEGEDTHPDNDECQCTYLKFS
jgi:hypothetical protein